MFKDNTKTIQTNRLILRKFTITDAEFYKNVINVMAGVFYKEFRKD